MSVEPNPMAWLPFSIAEAGQDAEPTDRGRPDLPASWAHLLERLATSAALVEATSGVARGNSLDLASGYRHLLVLLAAGIDTALRYDPDPVLRVRPTSTDDVISWGMECPDGLYTGASLRGHARYRLSGNRGTARYVGLQTMNGIAATANALVDELETDGAGNFEVILSAEAQEGNWLAIDGDHPTLVVRHFFYDWATEVPSTLQIERLDAPVAGPAAPVGDPGARLARQLVALGDFVQANLAFFLDFGAAPPRNGFLPGVDRSAMGAAAENRPVIGRWSLDGDDALVLAVEPPDGLYWSFSVGNPWWETVHYGRHQSSLNGRQAVVDSDGLVRVVLCARDPGVANWLDTAGHGSGAIILRCVRTDSAPTPTVMEVSFDGIAAALPPDTTRVTPRQRRAALAARRSAVDRRFPR